MGFLLPVDTNALQTEDVESLSSFLIRLSSEHGVSPGKLLNTACKKLGLNPNTVNHTILKQPPAYVVRPNSTNRWLVSLLAESTDRDIDRLNSLCFQGLSAAINRSQSCYSRHLRWCPYCIAEQLKAGLTGYFKLLWHLNGFTHCQHHGVVLQDSCASCGAQQDGWGYRKNLSECTKCGESLTVVRANSDRIFSWDFTSKDLVALVREISSKPGHTFPENSVRKSVSRLFDHAWENEEEEKIWSRIDRDECLAYIHCNKPITLQTARRIAHRLGLNLVDLLNGEVKESTRQLSPSWDLDLPTSLQPAQRRSNIDRKKIHDGICELMKTHTNPPMSLAEVARKLDISKGGIYFLFPDIAKKITSTREEWVERKKEREKLKAIIRAFKLLESHPEINKHSALKTLMRETELPKNLLWQQIVIAFDTHHKWQ